MGSKQRIIQQEEGLNFLKGLSEILNSPNAIREAHEEFRKQIKLTEKEESDAIEARAFIKKYEELSSDVKVREDALASEKQEFLTQSDDVSKNFIGIKENLDAREAEINAKSAALNARESDIQTNEKDFQKEREDLLGKVNNEQAILVSNKNALVVFATELEAERTSLNELKESLDIRAKKISLREQAADL